MKEETYHFYATITIICWSIAYVFTRLVLEHFSPFSLGFLRYLIASVSNYMFLTPFITILLGFSIINEKPDEGTILGGIIILTGFALYNFSNKKNVIRK